MDLSTQGYSKSINMLKNTNDALMLENKVIKQILEKLTQNTADKDQRIDVMVRDSDETRKEFRSKLKTLQFKLNLVRNQMKTYEDFKLPHTFRDRDLKIDSNTNFTDEMQIFTK